MVTKKIPQDCMPMCQSCAFFDREKNDEVGLCRRYLHLCSFLVTMISRVYFRLLGLTNGAVNLKGRCHNDSPSNR
jgi:hypothetical protein